MSKPIIIVATGLLLTLSGMVITFIIAPPIPIFSIGGGPFNTPEEEARIARSQDLQIAWAKSGVWMLVIGTALQLIGTTWQFALLNRAGWRGRRKEVQMDNEKKALRKRKCLYIFAFGAILFGYLLIVFCIRPPKTATLLLGAFAAFFQTVIAVSAIWGNEIRALFLGPKLELSLDRREGQLTHLREPNRRAVRYFHLKVENERKGTAATKTQVILYSIVPPYEKDAPEPLAVNGRLPFPWKFKGNKAQVCNVEAVVYSVIGPHDYCDLARLIEGSEFLEVLAEPWTLIEDFLKLRRGQKTTVKAIAIAENAQSNLLTLNISWDGVWPGEKDDHVTDHIKIDVAEPLSKRKRKEG